MNRICPTEEILSAYLSGTLNTKDKTETEKHLTSCGECRKLLADAHTVIDRSGISKVTTIVIRWIKINKWILGTATSLVLSFLFPKYFLQFLITSLITGGKWIIDTKSQKMLILIHEAWKRGDKNRTDDLISRFKIKK